MARRLAPLLIGLLILAACGTSSEVTADGASSEPCVTSVTTIPGDEFCPGFDPEAELGTDRPETADCPRPDVPSASAARPEDGWLGTTAPEPHYQLAVWRNPAPVANHSFVMDELIERAVASVPAGFNLVSSDATAEMGCPGPIEVSAQFVNDQGAEILIVWTTLDTQLEWFNEPVSGDVIRTELADGTELAANDFGNEGVKHRVWLAKPDGAFVKVIVAGANAPSQSGWPTTMLQLADAPAPTQAPLTLDETRQLAITIHG